MNSLLAIKSTPKLKASSYLEALIGLTLFSFVGCLMLQSSAKSLRMMRHNHRQLVAIQCYANYAALRAINIKPESVQHWCAIRELPQAKLAIDDEVFSLCWLQENQVCFRKTFVS